MDLLADLSAIASALARRVTVIRAVYDRRDDGSWHLAECINRGSYFPEQEGDSTCSLTTNFSPDGTHRD